MSTPHAGAGFGRLRLCVSAIAVAGVLGIAATAQHFRGVTDTEIVIGTVTDLSGVTAVQGVNNSDAIPMAFDDINAKGRYTGAKSNMSWRTADTPCPAQCRR